MHKEMTEIRHEAEWTILALRRVFGKRIDEIPKAKGGGQLGKNGSFPKETSIGRGDIPGLTRKARSLLLKLAKIDKTIPKMAGPGRGKKGFRLSENLLRRGDIPGKKIFPHERKYLAAGAIKDLSVMTNLLGAATSLISVTMRGKWETCFPFVRCLSCRQMRTMVRFC